MEFTIKGVVYRAGKLDAFTQLHMVRRLTPCAGRLATLVATVKPIYDDKGDIVDAEGDLSEAIMPLANAIAEMSDTDVEYIFNACLEVTERKGVKNSWAPLRVNGATMFDGLNLPMLLQVAYYVIRENLTDFFDDLPSISDLQGLLKATGLVG